MVDIITPQKLANLDRDISDGGKALNNLGTVQARLGRTFKTFPQVVLEGEQKITNAAKAIVESTADLLAKKDIALASINQNVSSVENEKIDAVGTIGAKESEILSISSQAKSKINTAANSVQSTFDERMGRFDNAINQAALAGAGENGWTDLLVQTADGSTQRDINERSLKNGDYPPSPHLPAPGSPVRLKFNPIMASFLCGISDPTHLDDDLNIFRGLNNPNAWHESNIGLGGFSVGRNSVPFAYISAALGHDCVGYGVASLVGGAGSCTGNPDVPLNGTNFGYCSLSWGKNTQARGRISNAMGERNLSESRFSSTDGYKCIAGSAKPDHPNYKDEGTEGAAARAHGYESEAYGNFAFAYGSFLRAYNGSQVIGKGINSGSRLEISKRGLGFGYNVDVPTIFCQEGPGINGAHAWIGFNTAEPLSKYDFRLGQSDTVTHIIDAEASDLTLTANEIKGRMSDGSFESLHNVIVTHPDLGKSYSTVQYRLNGTEYLTVDPTRKSSFNGEVESATGFLVAGKRVLGGQLPAISNTNGMLEDNARVLNAILDALRLHGQIAT